MRNIVFGMVASPATASGAKITGIIPAKESRLTNMQVFIKQGNYFADNKRNQIVIGEKLAHKLKVKLHSKVVITFSSKAGDIISGAFRVGGIYKSSNTQFDGVNVFANAYDINTLLGPDSGYHEMAMLLKDGNEVTATENDIKKQFPKLKTESWLELSPANALMSEMTDYVLEILMAVLMLGLAFAIINTMLMTVMERTRELGMLMAIGMNKGRTFSMLMYETIVLSFLGCPLGMGLAWLTIWYFGKHGIDLSLFSKALENFGYQTVIYTTLANDSYLQVSIIVLITAILSAIYPGLKAIRLKPTEAIRHI
jgi:ABC-type lipoprotein release transport system permease subunit